MPSAVVAAIAYDATTSTLRVAYVSGLIYDYLNVPEEVYIGMKKSFSKGAFLNKHVKGKYCFQKTTK